MNSTICWSSQRSRRNAQDSSHRSAASPYSFTLSASFEPARTSYGLSVLKPESEPPSPPALNADQRLHRVLPGLAMMKTTNTRSSHNSRIWRRPIFNVASLRRVLKTRVDAILVVINDIVVQESSQVARRRGARIAEFCLWMGLQGQAGDKWTCQTLKRNCPDRIKPDGTTT
jgi:hypothetical protein